MVGGARWLDRGVYTRRTQRRLVTLVLYNDSIYCI
jgi:hypothetical protein